MHDLRHPSSAFPNVSPRWLIGAAGIVLLTALGCAWLALCLLYWQGSWQLLYHPTQTVLHTPADLNIPFEKISFATTETGKTQLTGWWIPAPSPTVHATSNFSLLFLHDADGNLGEDAGTLAMLHRQGLPIFAIDYRGYGESEPFEVHRHPSEKQLRQDAEWSLTWMTLTRHVPPGRIILYGSRLGANLAAQLVADHSELAGLILDNPQQDAMASLFNDKRSRLVPAHWMVSDRYDLNGPASRLQVPSLWILPQLPSRLNTAAPPAFRLAKSRKSSIWLIQPSLADPNFAEELNRWLDDLATPTAPAKTP